MLLITVLAAYGAPPVPHPSSKPADVTLNEDVLPDNPLDIALDKDALIVSGVSETSFNKSTIDVQFLLKGAEFDLNRNEVILSVNDIKSVSSDLKVSVGKISAPLKLVDGKNLLNFKAYDSLGRPLYSRMTIWSGSNAVEVVVVDEKGMSFKKPVNIKISLEEDEEIYSSGTTTTGSMVFSNIPNRSVSIEAHTAGNITGLSIGLASKRKIIVTMIGNGNIKLVPYVEEIKVTPMPSRLK